MVYFGKEKLILVSRLLIDTFQMPDLSGDILDVGCGYGPIGLSIAKSLARTESSFMVDVNSRALQLAKDNADLNATR